MLLGLALGFGAGTAAAAHTAGTPDATFGGNGIVVTSLALFPPLVLPERRLSRHHGGGAANQMGRGPVV